MMNERHSFSYSSTADFMYKVYAWMAFGLGLSAVAAYVVAQNPVALKTLVLSPLKWVVFGLQLGIALMFKPLLNRASYATCGLLFSTYSLLVGISLSVLLLIYTMESIYLSLAITAGTFGVMALYGYFTKADLTSLDSFLRMGLFGLMIAIFANMWFQSPATQYYISLFAVGLFTLLIAYDIQKAKKAAQESMMTDSDYRNKVALKCAFDIYLDVINLFIHLLHLFGERKRN
jgi:FtsH-binding integral membrane protein